VRPDPDGPTVAVPTVLDADGEPVHDRGVTAAPGLFVVGLCRRSSRFLAGVGAGAEHLADHIAARTRVPIPA
jgi:putative flavoprotein involved in K+ transport